MVVADLLPAAAAAVAPLFDRHKVKSHHSRTSSPFPASRETRGSRASYSMDVEEGDVPAARHNPRCVMTSSINLIISLNLNLNLHLNLSVLLMDDVIIMLFRRESTLEDTDGLLRQSPPSLRGRGGEATQQ